MLYDMVVDIVCLETVSLSLGLLCPITVLKNKQSFITSTQLPSTFTSLKL
jgi:hypothetical protein